MFYKEVNVVTTSGEITMISGGFEVDGHPYWHLETAARRIGIHPNSLQRLWRQSGDTDLDRVGLHIGRGLYFNSDHLARLGYGQERGKN